jgi:hypothetical protein
VVGNATAGSNAKKRRSKIAMILLLKMPRVVGIGFSLACCGGGTCNCMVRQYPIANRALKSKIIGLTKRDNEDLMIRNLNRC